MYSLDQLLTLNLLRIIVLWSTPQRSNMPHYPNPLETTRINHEYLHELTEEQLKEREVIEREEEKCSRSKRKVYTLMNILQSKL